MPHLIKFIFILTVSSFTFVASADCPDSLNHTYKRLHSDESVNLCSLYQDKPVVIVNTASHCGYTKQFSDLETLYKKYQSQGVEVIGFTSDSFYQEAKDEEKAAEICYKNYGVTFTMLAPTPVKGKNANPTFQSLSDSSRSPSWNFNKYLVTETQVIAYGSNTKPLESQLETDLINALQ